MSLFYKRGNWKFGNRIQTFGFFYWDLDLIIIVLVLLASKSCLYPLWVTKPSYTSLGQSYKSKTCASHNLV